MRLGAGCYRGKRARVSTRGIVCDTRRVDVSGREVDDPASGQRWVFRRTGAETNGELLEADLYVRPGGYVRAHAHPVQEETFTGVSGTFTLDVRGDKRTIAPGDSVVIPPRTPHGFEDAPEAAHLVVAVRPALRLDAYFRAFLGLSRDGKVRMPAHGLPGPLLQIAVLMDRYAAEIAAAGVPIPLQRLVWRSLAALGRRRGYRDSFPEYGAP
jgi:quercetin dioxygenase-like cupin family protein